MSEVTDTVGRLLTQWQDARLALVEMERAERPDITDRFGRVWTWKFKSLYRHCGTACTADMIDSFGLPTQRALDNPNYELCDICLDGRSRNIRPCKPEWHCTHTTHAPVPRPSTDDASASKEEGRS